MRYALALSYVGDDFCGWQTQKKQPAQISVQDALETALSKVANQEKIKVVAAGRTDAGVHAMSQIVHFDSKQKRSPNQWLMGANSHLAKSIRINWLLEVDLSFHARFQAISRTYRYLILNQAQKSPFLENRALHIKDKLDLKKIRESAEFILGKHNFSAFRSSKCQAKNPVRVIKKIKIKRISENLICIEITANAYLQNMVRILVAAFLEVGKGHKPSYYLINLIKVKKRDVKLVTAKPFGLYLTQVKYPNRFNLSNLAKKSKKRKKIALSDFLAS